MLHEFLTSNRADLIERCRIKVAARRSAPRVTQAELTHGIPLFLDQLIKTLQVEQTSEPMQSRRVSGPAGGGRPVLSEMGAAAALHGRELLQQGFTVDQVVHDYGDLCQAITDLAFERKAPIEIDEFRTLNRCLDNGIAEAVTEYAYLRNSDMTNTGVQALNERLGFLAHELRNLLHTATLAFTAIKAGSVGVTGSTGAVLERSLIGLRTLVDRSLADVRVVAGMPPRRELLSLSDFVDQIGISALLEARARECIFTVSDVEERLAVDVDRDILLSALGNLLQNAFKFTLHGTEVSLHAYSVGDRILIDVEDHCGGLPPGSAEAMFLPFTQHGTDKSGLGLGLAICRRSVEANHGVLRVSDVPGSGCIFTIDLPRHAMP
jgi:signal transduction histidine kinase